MSEAQGRTVWRAKDAAWWRREWIVELGEEFGAEGPAVIDWLECEAKCQNDAGFVKAGNRTVGRGCFVDPVTVGHVVSRSVTLGLLVDYEESNGRFTCRISWWQGDQERGMAARRKAAQRNGATVDPDDSPPLSRSVPESHGESRSVPQKGKERTGTTTDHKRAHENVALPPHLAPHGSVVYRLMSEYAAAHGLAAVSKASLARAIRSRPRKPLVRACEDYLAYQERQPPAKRHKDLIRGYEWQLDNRYSDLAATEQLDDQGLPKSESNVVALSGHKENASDWLREINEGGAA